MRAIAACSVLVFHVWLFSSPDHLQADVGPLTRFLPDFAFGVTLFFTLSGFLLFRPFASAVMRGQPVPSIRKYLRNRALRILPAYWVILLTCSLLLQSVLHRTTSGGLKNGGLFNAGGLLRDMLLVQHYEPGSVGTGIGPAWSLAVEIAFYLALPLLVLLAVLLAREAATRASRRFAALAPAALMLAIGLCGKGAAAYLVPPVHAFDGWEADWHSVLERSIACQADLFAFGMALAVVRVDAEDGVLRLPRGWRPLTAAAALACYLVTAQFTFFDEHLSYSPFNTLMAFACALLVALVVLPARKEARAPVLLRILETRPMVAIGLASYSLFLWHEPIVRFLQAHDLTVGGNGGFFVNIAIVGAVAGVASAITYRWVEVPALRLKRVRPSRTIPEVHPSPEPAVASLDVPIVAE